MHQPSPDPDGHPGPALGAGFALVAVDGRLDPARFFALLLEWPEVTVLLVVVLLLSAGIGLRWRQQLLRVYRERSEMTAALRESEEQFRGLFETMALGVVYQDAAGHISSANPSAERILGLTLAQMQGRSSVDPQWKAIHEDASDFPGETHPAMVALRTGQAVHNVVMGVFHPVAGQYLWININAVPEFKSGSATPYRVYATFEDITERKRAEQALATKTANLQAIIETEPECVKIVSPEGVLLEMNPAGLKMIEAGSLAQAQSRPLLQFVVPEHRTAFRELLGRVMQGQSATLEFEIVGLKGGRCWLESHAVPLLDLSSGRTNLLSVTRNITERMRAAVEKEKLEAQNRQLQKSESLGRMAGAIAHHFNNQLQTVIMNLELVLDDLPRNAGSVASLTEAAQSARKAAEVSSLMLTYLGQSAAKRDPLDLSAACRQGLPLLRAVMPPGMVLATDLLSPGPTIQADANQIQQVLASLVTNASEASGDRHGTIRLAVKTVAAADIPAAHRFPVDHQLPDTVHACLEVADAGCGIGEEDIEKLFDPFFSTKFTGRGMGLAAVLGIVRAHRGIVTVESELNRGSVFRIFFPVSTDALAPKPVPVANASETAGGGLSARPAPAGTVLVIEDEEAVRKALMFALKHAGYTVLAAQDGVEAVEIFRQHQGEIGCVLCDLTMPRMNGWETLTALRALVPDIPVILSSGHSETRARRDQHPEQPQAFLSKPYDRGTLLNAISRALASRQS